MSFCCISLERWAITQYVPGGTPNGHHERLQPPSDKHTPKQLELFILPPIFLQNLFRPPALKSSSVLPERLVRSFFRQASRVRCGPRPATLGWNVPAVESLPSEPLALGRPQVFVCFSCSVYTPCVCGRPCTPSVQ